MIACAPLTITTRRASIGGMENLAAQFEEGLRDAIVECRKLGYHPHQFEKMLNTSDGVKTAKKLITSGDLQYGLQRIVNLGHPELTVEAIMCEEVFRPIFTKGERDGADWRLKLALEEARLARA